MKVAALVRKSLHQPYWYDKTNWDHLSNFELITTCLQLPLFGTVVLAPILSPWPLFIFGILCILGLTLYKGYNTYYHRYFRIIRRKEEGKQIKEATFYVVQTHISHKKIADIQTDEGLKWIDVASDSSKENMEQFFDRNTMENKTAIVLKSSIKKAHLKPSFIQIFMAKMNISKKETKALSLIFYGVFFILCCLFFMLLPSNPIKYLLVLGIVILCGVAVYLFYTKKTFRFLRVIEKKVSQGRYTNKTYHVQSLISKTENEKILETNDLKWTDYYPDEFKNAVDRENAVNYFVQKTTKIEVIDEAC